MKWVIFALLATLLISPASGKFLSQTFINITDQYSDPSFTFWFNGKLHATFDVLNGPRIGMHSKLVRYDTISADGKVTTTEWEIPLTCTDLYCNIDTTSLYIYGNELIFITDSDGCCTNFRWVFYRFNLELWKLVGSVEGTENYSQFLPYSAKTMFLQSQQPYFGSQQVLLQTLDLDSFKMDTPKPLLLASFGGVGYPSNNTIYGCGMLPSGNLAPVIIDTENYSYSRSSTSTCYQYIYKGPAVSDPDQVLIGTSSSSNNNIDVTVSTLSNPYKILGSVTLQGGYPTSVMMDEASSGFVFTREWLNQSTSMAYQISYAAGKVSVIDIAAIPAPYFVYQMSWPALGSYSVDTASQQLAVVVTNSNQITSRGILVFKYDTN